MNPPKNGSRYSIHVTRHDDVYELRIHELLLAVKARNLRDGYDRLLKRRDEILETAYRMGMLGEVPPPRCPPNL